MRWPLTPRRRRGVEILDDPLTPREIRARAMSDVARSNLLFGGTRAVLSAIHEVLPRLRPRAVLLDVGTGLADIPDHVRRGAKGAGVALTIVGLDVSEHLARAARSRLDGIVVGDALRIPLADSCADVVTCSQLLHHFDAGDAPRVLAELHRVARRCVIVADLRRSWIAAGGFLVAANALRFHPVTRSDGVTSVLRGFTTRELARLVERATGTRPDVRRSPFWRLTATWGKTTH